VTSLESVVVRLSSESFAAGKSLSEELVPTAKETHAVRTETLGIRSAAGESWLEKRGSSLKLLLPVPAGLSVTVPP